MSATAAIAVNGQEEFEHWCAACAKNKGVLAIPEHQAEEYLNIAQAEGVYNGWKDRQEGGKYHSQCSFSHPIFGRLVFNIWSASPIFS